LILGDYIYDNTNDNNHQFVISIHMGGVYKNTRDRKFKVEVDNSLCDSILFNSQGDTIRPMPAKYYTLASKVITIPKGNLYGGVTVQLTDAFFNDPRSIGLCYVVPLRIISSNDVDTILSGKPVSPDADPRIVSDWSVASKDFTMFAVNYINEYHGTYFHYGKSELKDNTTNTVVEDSTYQAKYVVNNKTANLITTGRYQVSCSIPIYSKIMTGSANIVLTFKGNTCTVSAPQNSLYQISGTGEFKSNAYEWGDQKRDGITLKYTISDGQHTYAANDVFIILDSGIVMQVYHPVKY
jgi:hypothetical protein